MGVCTYSYPLYLQYAIKYKQACSCEPKPSVLPCIVINVGFSFGLLSTHFAPCLPAYESCPIASLILCFAVPSSLSFNLIIVLIRPPTPL